MFAVVINGFYSHIATNHDVTTYDNTTLEAYDKLQEIDELSKEMNTTLTTVQQGNFIDVVGGLVQGGYTVIKTTWASFDAYTSITGSAFENVALGDQTTPFRSTALLIGLMLFLFALISILVKKNA